MFDASILTGPATNYPVADSFNRALERDFSTGDIPHVFVSSAIWDLPFGPRRAHDPGGVLGAIARDWMVVGVVTLQSGVPIADHADHQLQRVRRLWYAAAESRRESGAAG